MHSYLKAIGFSNIKNRIELDRILGLVADQPTEKYVTKGGDVQVLTEFKKEFADHMGIIIRGEYDNKGSFHFDHYFPYFTGTEVTVKEEVVINKRVDTDAYTGMCDDLRLGVSLIFYLQNSVDYIDHISRFQNSQVVPIILTALSIEGKVLLGIDTNERQIKNQSAQIKHRNKLIAEAKAGNQEAIDSLTIDDIDLYAMISRRARVEDIYSIVDNSFIPYGSESDNYTVLGTILDSKIMVNNLTGEEVYDLLISCNDMIFNICINKFDLEGIPTVGRRFKGNIWMQGKIDFANF